MPTTAPLGQRVGDSADSAQIADAVIATWRDIDAALAPIIGQRGVAALYHRSLHVAGETYPWLASVPESMAPALDLTGLKSALARQASTDATLGGNHLLQAFQQLLNSLIGPSLSERLLRSVWADSSSGASAQDTRP